MGAYTLNSSEDINLKSKKERIIEAKLQNPDVKLSIIAENEGSSYGWARTVWSKYKRELITNKGGALTPLSSNPPFLVQNQGFCLEGPTYWYRDCPLEVSSNRNGQKVFRCPYYSVIFYPRGSVNIYIYSAEWDKQLRKWLSSWMATDDIEVFFEYLVDKGGKHYCVNAPGIPTGYKFNIPGIGSFATDKTPFKKGTFEFEVDPGFDKRLRGIEKSARTNSESQHIMEKNMILFSQNMGKFVDIQKMISTNMEKFGDGMEEFGVGMKEHMKLIKSVEKLVISVNDVVVEMQEQRKQGIIYRVTNWFRGLFK